MVKRQDGKIYIGTLNGISLLDPMQRTFKSFRVKVDETLSQPANSFGSLVLLPNGKLVAGSSIGISVFDENLNLIYQYLHFKPEDVGKERFQFVNTILSQSDGNCLINGHNGLWRFHDADNRMELIDSAYLGIKTYRTIRTMGVNDLAFCYEPSISNDSIVVLNTVTETFSKTRFIPLNDDDFRWALQFKLVSDSTLIATSHLQGLFLGKFDPQTLSLRLSTQKYLPKYHVTTIFVDREKRLWLGSQYGLLSLSFSKQSFNHNDLSGLKALNITPYVRSISKINDHYYIGVQNKGVWKFDKYFNQAEHLELEGTQDIWNLNNWGSDTLYVGSQLQFFTIGANASSPVLNRIGPAASTFKQFRDSHGYIWAGFYGGVLRYNPRTNEKMVWQRKDNEMYPGIYDAWGIAETDSGYIWMCGDTWHRWNPYKQIFDLSFKALPGTENQEGPSYQVVSNGGEEIIFSKYANGLWKWKPGTQAEKIIISNRAFEFVEEIFPDPQPHCFWFVLKAGIGYLNVESGQYRFFNEISGLPEGEVIQGFYLDHETDSMYIGMDNGILSFNRSEVISSKKSPSIFITGLNLINDNQFFDVNHSVRLKATNRNFNITFSSPEYEYASSIRYEYRLSDQHWIDLGQTSNVRFSNLGTGNYKFEARAFSPNGSISPPALLMIEILPFYYETWWFRTQLLLVIAALIYVWFRWRLTQLQKMEKMRQSIAADLHDEVGASLTSVQILAELATRSKNSDEQTDVLNRLKLHSKKATTSLREIVWNIHPKNDLMDVFIGELTRYAGELLEDVGIIYTLNIDPFDPKDKLSLSSRQQLTRVFKEILSNLVRHSGAKHAKIIFKKEAHSLSIIIQDDGIGFD
ncbi:MAG: histidine kinase, partial [Saprospiraceae bacterium]